MAVGNIKGLYVYDEEADESGVAKIDLSAIDGVIEDDIAPAVQDWLDEHPEATTTVQDNSVTEAKLSSDLQRITNGIHEKPLLYGEGNTAVANVYANYPEVSAGFAATDIGLHANNFATRFNGETYTGQLQSVTATTATTVTTAEDISDYVKPGMWVDLYTETPTINRNHAYFGIVASCSGKVITVAEWRTHTGTDYDRPTSGTVATPAGVIYAVVNPVFKMYANHGYYRLMDVTAEQGANWTSELIGYQTELYTDVPGVIYGYDVVVRQNDNDASAYAFRARCGDGKWTKVLHVTGDADAIVSHDNEIIINGDDAINLPYVNFGSPSAPSPVILTGGANVNLSAIDALLSASARFTLVNNSDSNITVSAGTGHYIFFGQSNHRVPSFGMKPREVLDVVMPHTGTNYWVYGVHEFCPNDTFAIPTAWYPFAMNQSTVNNVEITLPRGHRTCAGATISGSAAIRIGGNTVVPVKSFADTEYFDSVSVTLTNGIAVLNFDLVDETVRNDAGIIYLSGCTLTFT